MKGISLAIAGVTGMVGRTFIDVLEEKNLPIENFYIFASSKSAGDRLTFKGKEYIVEELNEQSFDRKIDIALFSAGGEISLKFAPIAVSKGCVVIDNSSAWRMDKNVPLIVPEVNPEDISWNKGIISNPNCSTIQAVVALKPLQEKYGIKRIVYSTYQAVSGAGMGGWKDLETGMKGQPPKKFIYEIAGNCIPHIDVFLENGYTKEEEKMIEETKKILHDDSLKITSTCVRVPVFNGHSESVNVELKKEFDFNELVNVLKNADGVVLENDISKNQYPMPINIEGSDKVYIGRLRRDFSIENGVNMWVVADNVRKGAASNAVQIAELLINKM